MIIVYCLNADFRKKVRALIFSKEEYVEPMPVRSDQPVATLFEQLLHGEEGDTSIVLLGTDLAPTIKVRLIRYREALVRRDNILGLADD
jgi:hypothetical protein